MLPREATQETRSGDIPEKIGWLKSLRALGVLPCEAADHTQKREVFEAAALTRRLRLHFAVALWIAKKQECGRFEHLPAPSHFRERAS
jgi:hypothetical protein